MSGKETVNHPEHYCSGGYEAIEIMDAVFGREFVEGFCVCNAFKYLWRHKRKGGLEDLKKARWYLDKYIELAEGQKPEDGFLKRAREEAVKEAKRQIEESLQVALDGAPDYIAYVSEDLSRAVEDMIKGCKADFYIYGRREKSRDDRDKVSNYSATQVISGLSYGYEDGLLVYNRLLSNGEAEYYNLDLIGAIVGRRGGNGENK